MARTRSRRRRSRRGRAPARRRSGPLIVAAVVAGVLALDWLADRPGLVVTVAVVLLGCGVAAITLYLAWVGSRRHREKALTRSVAVADSLSGQQFERWIAALMRRTGFTRVRVSGGAGDLGADITALAPGGRLLVVQCKRYRVGRRVGSPDVQKLAGTARAVHGADLAAIVTTGGFTEHAEALAARLGIGLVDRDTLARWATDDLLPVALVHPVPGLEGSVAGTG